jgi:hypothetical protein
MGNWGFSKNRISAAMAPNSLLMHIHIDAERDSSNIMKEYFNNLLQLTLPLP